MIYGTQFHSTHPDFYQSFFPCLFFNQEKYSEQQCICQDTYSSGVCICRLPYQWDSPWCQYQVRYYISFAGRTYCIRCVQPAKEVFYFKKLWSVVLVLFVNLSLNMGWGYSIGPYSFIRILYMSVVGLLILFSFFSLISEVFSDLTQ